MKRLSLFKLALLVFGPWIGFEAIAIGVELKGPKVRHSVVAPMLFHQGSPRPDPKPWHNPCDDEDPTCDIV